MIPADHEWLCGDCEVTFGPSEQDAHFYHASIKIPERVKALEAVAEAAERVLKHPQHQPEGAELYVALARLRETEK